MTLKYLTFNQALLAVGLIGLTLALIHGQGSSFAVAASLLVDDGPSIALPVALLVVSIAVPLGTLAIAWRRMGLRLGDGEGGKPLTYPQARLIIGLAGLTLIASLAPQLVSANSAAGWDGSAADSLAYLLVAFMISALILGTALRSMRDEPSPIDGRQLLVCLGLTALVIVAGMASALNTMLVTGAEDAPELKVFDAKAAFRVYSGVSLVLVATVLLGLLRTRGGGAGRAIVAITFLLGITASVHLVYALVVGVPLAVLVALSHLSSREGSGTGEAIRSGPLLASVGLLCLVMSASTIKYVISLYHACSGFDTSLYLWPTLALALAVAFSLGLIGVGVVRLRPENGAAGDVG